ncbi:MAG: hypothetical protein JNK25_07540 [Phycisphaerae bacterium]|nr:hypothetical protein [Phycisphaerae bacterium]
MRQSRVVPFISALMCLSWGAPAQTAFTYQGELTVDGSPAQGLHDLRFRLYDSVGTQVGPTLCADNVAVAGGRFTVALDFGAVFGSAASFLEIEARADAGLNCSNLAGFTILGPRQPVTPAPKATHALNANSLGGQAPAFYLNADNMNAGLLSIARGGTGAGTAAAARANLTVPGLAVANTFSAGQSILLGMNTVGLIVRPIVAATSDLQQWRNAFDTTITRITSSGALQSAAAVQAPAFNYPAPVTRTLSVPAGAFIPGSSFFDYENNGSRFRGMTAGQNAAFTAPINLPQDATITAVHLHAQDNAATSDATLILYRQSLTVPSGFTNMAQVASSGAATGIRIFSDTTINVPVVDNTQYQYHLYLSFFTPTTPSSLDVWGVRVEYTVNGAE